MTILAVWGRSLGQSHRYRLELSTSSLKEEKGKRMMRGAGETPVWHSSGIVARGALAAVSLLLFVIES
jgi:hypothetical protein